MAEPAAGVKVLPVVEVHMRRLLVALVVSPVVVSCSASRPQTPSSTPSDSAELVSPSSVVHATVDGPRIFGPQVELARDENGLHGRGPLGVVHLRKENDSLRGMVGGGATELYLESAGDDGFSLRGMYSGTLGSLEVRSDRIQGQLGRCQYNLRRHDSENGVAYNGRRICGQRWLEPATFTLSPGVASLNPIDRAALIAVLLGR
jgi:hypothetical protein